MRDLNLIPYEIKEIKLKKENKRKLTSYIILALCFIFVVAYFPLMYSIGLNKKAMDLKARVDSKALITENYNKVKAFITSISKPIALAEGVEKNKVYLTQTIDNLSKYIPGNLKFTTFSYQNGAIAINGESTSYNSCAEFIANLELSKEFPTAKIGNINLITETKIYSFTITIPQKEVVKNEQTK